MNKNLQLIDAIITNLDRLTLRGVQNMGLVIDSINMLGVLKDALAAKSEEVKENVQNKAQ